jgi:hypothetical protein
MVEKLAHRIDSFLACRTSGDNYTLTALRYGRRLVYETTEVMAADFLL